MNNKIKNLLLSTACLFTLCSCGEEPIEDTKVTNTITLDCGEIYTIKTNKDKQIVSIEANNDEGSHKLEKTKILYRSLNTTLNNLLDKSLVDEQSIIVSFDSESTSQFQKEIDTMISEYKTLPTVISSILPKEEKIDTTIVELQNKYHMSYDGARLQHDLAYDYPEIGFDTILNYSLDKKVDLLMDTHERTLQQYRILNATAKLHADSYNTFKAYLESQSYTDVIVEDSVIKDYELNGDIYINGLYIKDSTYVFVALKNNEVTFTKTVDLGMTLNINDIYAEYKEFYDGIVEPVVNEVCARVLQGKFQDYRDYIYDYLYYNNRLKLTSPGFRSESLYLEYMLDSLDVTLDDITNYTIEYYKLGADRYYKSCVISKNKDMYIVYGNCFTGNPMKIYKNNEEMDIKLVVEDRGFSLSTISHLTKGGKY